MPGTIRNNPELRMQDYQGAFRFYLGVDDKFIDDLRLFSFTLPAYRRFLPGKFSSAFVLEKVFYSQLMQQ
jgi:hypothetical protein